MRVAGGDVHHLQLLAAHVVFDDLIAVDAAEADDTRATHHQELLVLAVVPVLTFHDVGLAHIHAHLTAVRAAQHLGKAATGIHVHFQRVAELILRQVAQVGGVQSLGKGIPHVRNADIRTAGAEALNELRNATQLHGVHGGHLAEVAHAGFVAAQRAHHLRHQVIDVDEAQGHARVVHGDGQVMRDVVAEGGHGAVVVRAAPLAEEVREAVDEHAGAGLGGVIAHQLLAGALALAIGIVQLCLGGGRNHHRAGIAVLFERVQQGAGEAEIALHELLRVLRAVHAGQVEHEIGLGAVLIQQLAGCIEVELHHLDALPLQRGALGLAIADIFQLGTKVLANKALRACNQYIHSMIFIKCFEHQATG